MGIRESLLNTITSVADSDFVRIVTSAGVSSKATVQNLFKSFETGLGAKSSLTTSDYIRVVGSDDVSYKQSVSDVICAFPFGQTASRSVTDANSAVDGVLYAGTGVSNLPENYVILVTYTIGSYRQQLAYPMASSPDYFYHRKKSANTWTSWVKSPTRAEVDALNSNQVFKQYTTTSFANLDTAIQTGTNPIAFIADVTASDGPVASNHYTVIGWINGTHKYGMQLAFTFDTKVYKRIRNNQSSWGSWISVTMS